VVFVVRDREFDSHHLHRSIGPPKPA
ncbi:uncharacterized protein METZ01_LOCUS463295, partial [marine metagenome]